MSGRPVLSPLGLPASTSAGAGLNVGVGVDPTSPANGDIWQTSTDLKARINGATRVIGPIVGEVRLLPKGSYSGWLECDGSYYSQSAYPALAAAIGTPPDFGPVTFQTIASNPLLGEIIYANSQYVCVSGTNIGVSSDAVTWTVTTPLSNNRSRIRYLNGVWVAFNYTTNSIDTSPDLSTWTTRTPLSGQYVTDVEWSAALGLYVAVGSGGGIATSPDLATWTGRTSGTTLILNSCNLLNGTLVAVTGATATSAYGSLCYILTSTDAVTWTKVYMPFMNGPSSGANASAYGNGVYVINTGFGPYYATSPTGTWTRSPIAAINSPLSQGNLIFDGSHFVIFAAGFIGYSSDGIDWRIVTPGGASVWMVAPNNMSNGTNTSNPRIALQGGKYTYFVPSSGAQFYIQKYSYNTSTQFPVPKRQPHASLSGLEGGANTRAYIYAGV